MWPQELKPFFIDLMLAACILGYGAELCDSPLYVVGNDISDMFHTFALATSKLVDVAVQSTISSRLSYMDFSEETTAHFNDVARSMLSMGSVAPRAAGAL